MITIMDMKPRIDVFLHVNLDGKYKDRDCYLRDQHVSLIFDGLKLKFENEGLDT
jgi:hypothetical protein